MKDREGTGNREQGTGGADVRGNSLQQGQNRRDARSASSPPVPSSPSVSIVIPTYKHQDFVVKTLESVWAQTFGDYEIIVVNDGSPDKTHEVLQPFVESGRIQRYIKQANAGQSAARNRGIAEARGEFIALLDDDDLWPPDKLEKQVAALREKPNVSVVYGSLECMDDAEAPTMPADRSGTPLDMPCLTLAKPGPSGDLYAVLAKENIIITPGQCLIRRTALDILKGPLDSSIWGADDWDLWLSLAERGEFLYLPHIALRYRWHAGNASRDHVRMRSNVLALYRKHLARNHNSPERLAALTTAYRWMLGQTVDHFLHLAWMDCHEGEGREAVRKLLLVARAQRSRVLTRHYQRLLWRSLGQSFSASAAQRKEPEG